VILYLLAIAIFMLGVYAVVAKKNLIKIVIGMLIVEYAINLMLVLVGYRSNGLAPIITEAGESTSAFVDPLPQAMVVTSIVIGLALAALMVALCVRLYERYGTFDILHIRKLKG